MQVRCACIPLLFISFVLCSVGTVYEVSLFVNDTCGGQEKSMCEVWCNGSSVRLWMQLVFIGRVVSVAYSVDVDIR